MTMAGGETARKISAADWAKIREFFRVCPECRRIFCLAEDDAAAEWYYGHDCEGSR